MLYPTVTLASLSKDAQRLYQLGTAGYNKGLTLDRNWFDRKQLRRSVYDLNPAYIPRPRLLDAMSELTASHYARRVDDRSFWMLRVDPAVYTIATGDGPWDLHVWHVGQPDMSNVSSRLLAILSGAEIHTPVDDNILSLKVPYPGARCGQCTASITLRLPTFPRFYGRGMVLWGVVEDAYLYPLDIDPTLVDIRDRSLVLDEPVPCDNVYCAQDPHPRISWTPPEVDLDRPMVRVEIHAHPEE